VRWNDLVRGESHIDCASLSDPVLQREDGSYLYTFTSVTSVVDDVDLGVTHVIRGEDHVTNTAGFRFSTRWRVAPRSSAITIS
jgi:glutamyl-tRNA synthetase